MRGRRGRSASTNMAAVAVYLLLMTVFGVSAVFSGVSVSDGVIRAQPGSSLHLRLYGSGLQNDTWPWVTVGAAAGQPCFPGPDSHMRLLQEFSVSSEQSGLITLQGLHTDTGEQSPLQPVCTCNGGSILTLQGRGVEEKPPWPEGDPQQQCPSGSPSSKSQDPSTTSQDAQGQQILAPWLLAFLIVLCVLLSGLLRGLQVSTLALEAPELGLLRDWGTPSERLNASRLHHLRTRWGGFTLISLLTLCCITNSAVAVLLYNATGSIVAAIFAAAAMLLLAGEALPAAICSRWGPWLASKSLWLTHIFLLIISPVSFPLSWLLELVFRQDPSCCRLRLRILEMARCGDPYSELVRDEFSKGALRNRTVEDILTPVNECFMLPSDALLDFTTMSKIMESGYTRIPVYENERSNIVDILYVKDLAFVDPDDCTPLSTITRFYSHPVHFVFSDTKLDAVLEEFKKGKSHLAIVQKVNNEGEGDPFYEVMGLVTLEDVIEEIIKSEILDESEDYKRKVKKKRPPLEPILIPRGGEDLSFFKTCEADQKVKISPQLLLSTQRFLSQEVELFSTSHVSEKVLLHLLKLPGVTQEVKFDESDHFSAEHYLYLRSQPVDYFILILQGQVQVEIGKENLRFENGAFTYYGVAALSTNLVGHHSGGCEQNESPDSGLYCPDYTVRAMTDLQIVKVSRLQYLNAVRSSNPHTNSQSPDSIELKILPNSQTQLLNIRNTDSAPLINTSGMGKIESFS